MAERLIKFCGIGAWDDLSDPKALHEAKFLKLNCDKAHAELDWYSALTIDECLQMTAAWYKKFYTAKPQESMYESCTKQIAEYYIPTLEHGNDKHRQRAWPHVCVLNKER